MKNRDEFCKGIIIFIWSAIILMTAVLLSQNGIVINNTGKEKTKKNLVEQIVDDFSVYLMKKSVPLTGYVTSDYYNLKMNNPVLEFLIKLSPIGKYILVYGNEKSDESQIVVEEDSTRMTADASARELALNKFPSGSIGYIFGETYRESYLQPEDATAVMANNKDKIAELKRNLNPSYLLKNFYVIDSTTNVDSSVFNVRELINKNLMIEKSKDKPQILIYHTHATSEAFSDSVVGVKGDTVVGAGACLAKILSEKYGYQVMHDETEYDKVNGATDRNKAYNNSLSGVKKILGQNPTIEVIVDLHRDGIKGDAKRVAMINDKPTAPIMFFNGISRNQNGNIDYLANPNLQSNLAFSLQLKLKAMEKYPTFTKENYLKGYRYNMHLRARSLLIEMGSQNNTVEEAKNAMEPLADILNDVLSGNTEE